MRRLVGLWLALLALAPSLVRGEAEAITLETEGVEIPLTRYAAQGGVVAVWLPSEYGVLSQEHAAARELAENGVETWLPDLYGARFLPPLPSSAETLPAQDVYAVLRAAQAGKREVWLITAGRGAKYALEGARLWREGEGAGRPLAGAILLYPNLYAAQPEPGHDPDYLPIAMHTALRVYILQGDRSPWYWTLDTLEAALRASGSTVSTTTFPGIRDRFYFRERATPEERALGERLPELILRVITPPKESP